MKAIWKDTVLAESDATIVIEGNHYFPPDSVRKHLLRLSQHLTHCLWKGEASYYDVVVHGDQNQNAAWFYATPRDAASEIKDYVAFRKGVRVTP